LLCLELGDERMRGFLMDWEERGADAALRRAGFESVEHLEEAWTAALE